MEVSEQASKKVKTYCGDGCKSKGYRQRKKATEMRDKGMSQKKIAHVIGVDKETVREWFGGK